MIPQEKSEAVTRALDETFGVTAFDDICNLTTSLSSDLVFRIVVQGSPFLLRIIKRVADPTCHFRCMQAAAEACLAPRVWYISTEDRLCITDFVKAVPFPLSEARVRMANALQALHALPPFPTRASHLNTSCTFLLNKGAALDGFVQRFEAANILSKDESEELFDRYAQLAAVYRPHDSDMVSSHNDLYKPDNVLFDGHHVWLVDWEAAFLNDRYADLAVVANFAVINDADEREYLQEYFGHAPDEYQTARFFLMRQVMHIFYAMVYLLLGSSGKPLNRSENVPEFTDFHRRMWAGEVNVRDNDTKTVYGRIHCNQFLENMEQARSKEALRIVSGRHR